MSEALKFLDGLIEERINELHTSMPARVERFDEAKCTADVQPLFKRTLKSGQQVPLPLLMGLPTLKFKTKEKTYQPFFESGDTVLVVFTERSLDSAGSRKHDLSDGVIVGLLE